MTNRDYLKELDNKKLAAFIIRGGNNDEICFSMKKCYSSCQKCIEKWLEKKRKNRRRKRTDKTD